MLKRVAERRQRNVHHQADLMELGWMDNPAWDVALQKITEVGALDVHEVSARLFNEDGLDQHDKTTTPWAENYPRYVRALHEKRSVVAVDQPREDA